MGHSPARRSVRGGRQRAARAAVPLATVRDVPVLRDVFGRRPGLRTSTVGDALSAQAGQTPLEPRRCDPSRWVSTMPTASISAYIVVGPTKVNPLRLSAFDSASDSGEVVGTSA